MHEISQPGDRGFNPLFQPVPQETRIVRKDAVKLGFRHGSVSPAPVQMSVWEASKSAILRRTADICARNDDDHSRGAIGSSLEAARVDVENELGETGHVNLLIIIDCKVAALWAVQITAFLDRFGDLFHLRGFHGVIARADG
jgi:hypothetical protein